MFVEKLWEILGKKHFLCFGKECISACIWMIFSLFFRTILIFLRLDSYIPAGFIFAFPYFIQMIGGYVPIMHEIFPILPNRLTDSILGRITPSNLLVIIPSHFMGCMFGTVLFKCVCPIALVFEPIIYSPDFWFQGMITESIVMCMYICTLIAMPEILEVNRLPAYLCSLPMFLLMLVKVPDRGSALNPAASYALWYVSGQHAETFQAEHLVGPILGAILAGIICTKFFPDDPGSWRKSRVGLKLL
mmetsp:Transcript_17271/g.16604  ORF Transcript_17271/g.16604 Transcript_17271/m.16604 type:complete len:246 (-) Transcript_17271:112-849(-)